MKTSAADIQVIHLELACGTQQQAAESIATIDWSRTPLGALSQWSPTLRIAVDMLQLSPFPCALVWGPQLSVIHNQAYPGRAPQGSSFHTLCADAWERVGEAVFQALEGQGSLVEDVLLPFASDTQLFTCCYSPIRDESGTVAGFMHTILPASASLEATREWRQRAQSFEAQLGSYLANSEHTWQLSPDVMLMLDTRHYVHMANPAWQRLLGWSEEAQPAVPWLDMVHAADRTEASLALTALRQGLVVAPFDARLRHADGHYCWFSWHTVSAQAMPILVGRDITETRHTVQRLTEAAVHESLRMESVAKVTGGLAHEMNNVLSGVGSSLELLEMRLLQGRTERLEDYVRMARECAERAIGLTHNLLVFARSQPLSPTPLDINQLLREAEPMLRQALSGDMQLEWQMDVAPWPVQLDAHQLRSALLHLCSNAREGCLGRGRVSIRTANERLTGDAEQPSTLPMGDYLMLQIEDDGHGMSADDVARAFEPFFTSKPLGHGAGLGLPMVHGFVRQSGGQVWIESQLGRGTRVVMMFPRYDGRLPEQAIAEPDAQPVHGQRLLLIDDEVNLRGVMKEALLDRGYQVNDVTDANAALGQYRSAGPFDLVITDIGLPGGFSGIQVAKALRMIDPGQKVLFITGFAQEPVQQQMLEQPGTAVLYKPFSLETLSHKVQNMLHQ